MSPVGSFGHYVARLRHALRVTALASLLIWCTASSCLQMDSDIEYATGYGYVVRVRCSDGCTYDYGYATFDTYQQAVDWRNKWVQQKLASLPPGFKAFYTDGQFRPDGVIPYREIERLAGPAPITTPSDSLQLNPALPYVPQ
jgi:hypothetical protein